MKKRILSTLLALCMVLTLLPGAALAVDTDVDTGADTETTEPTTPPETETAELTQLAQPTNLHWGTGEADNGYLYWEVNGDCQNRFLVEIFKSGPDDTPVFSEVITFKNHTSSTFSDSRFVIRGNYVNGASYNFSVKSLGDGKEYSDSFTAYSLYEDGGNWEYTAPASKLGTVTGLAWSETWPEIQWTPLNDANVIYYLVEVAYSSTASGEHETVQSFSGNYNINGQDSLRDYEIMTYGSGYYYFRVKALSKNVEVCANGDWSQWSVGKFYGTTEVTDKLDELLEKGEEVTVTEIKDALTELGAGKVENAMLADKTVADRIAALEEKAGISATVNNQISSFEGTQVVGASLNTSNGSKATLNVLPTSNNLVPPALSNSTVAVKFSMDLAGNGVPTGELAVPVQVKMPIPSSINPDFLHIFHYRNGADREPVEVFFDKELVGNQWYARFVLTHFSDFAFAVENNAVYRPSILSLTIPTFTGGTVTTATRFPSAGDWVVLNVTPNEGYELEKLTVTSRYGQTAFATDLGNGRWGFTMPGADVTVSATFTETNPAPTFNYQPGTGSTGSTGYMDIIYPGPSMSFTDVQPNDWFYDSVNYVYTRRLMNGVSDTAFAPQGTTTRAMIWTVLARLSGMDTTGGESWYERGQIWAMNKGITDGTAPNGDITREQLVTMLWRFKGSPYAAGALDQFSDSASVSPYASGAVSWAAANNLLKGDNGALNPQGTATRAEVAAILQRFCQNFV